MRAVIIGAGMGGLLTALALRQSNCFSAIDIFEQTKKPATAGAGLNVPPNGARLCKWLGVDLDGGDPFGPHGAINGGRAAILKSSRQFNEDGSTKSSVDKFYDEVIEHFKDNFKAVKKKLLALKKVNKNSFLLSTSIYTMKAKIDYNNIYKKLNLFYKNI